MSDVRAIMLKYVIQRKSLSYAFGKLLHWAKAVTKILLLSFQTEKIFVQKPWWSAELDVNNI